MGLERLQAGEEGGAQAALLCGVMHTFSIPSVDKDTQGFRSQTARHNCVVLI